jgi:peptide chain release factor subunit 1
MTNPVTSVRRAKKNTAHGAQTVHEVVDRIANLGSDGGWVVSCYLKLEPRDRSRGKYLIKLKNRIKRRLEWIDANWDLPRSERGTIERDLAKIRQYLELPTNLPEGQGIAVFASSPRKLFEAVPLPRVFRSRLGVDRGPLVRELLALDDEFGRMLCVVYDRATARFFEVTAFGAEEGTALHIEDPEPSKFRARRTGQLNGHGLAMPGEHNHTQRIKEEKHRHYAAIAQRLFAMSRAEPTRGIVLATVGANAAGVEPHLHRYVRDLVIGPAKLNAKSCSPGDVLNAVFAVREERERAREAEHVRDLQEGLGSRWAVNGVDTTLDMLARGQVRMLLVEPTAQKSGFRCGDTGRLSTTRDCRGEGPIHPVEDIIDEAMEEALQQGCEIDVIEGDASTVDGLAALLRFARR